MGKKNVLVRFRSALGGFHKADVTKYLVKLHEEQKAAVEELEKKAAALEQENEMLRQAVEGNRLEELEQQNLALTQQLEEMEAKLETLTQAGDPALREKELEAYRRAEAMERRASQRFRQVSSQLEEISANLAQQLTGTVDSARTALNAIDSQLDLLQGASEQLSAAMQTGTEKLETIGSTIEN